MSKVLLARLVQAGFLTTGAAALLIVYRGCGGSIGALLAIAVTMPFSGLIVFGMRCRNCGVSYYFDPGSRGRNLTGVNLIKPVAIRCLKCGAER